jgi:hypothetical protein
MEKKSLTATVRAFSLLLLVAGTCATAEDFRPGHFSGIVNDYSPSNVKGGPWEMHGQWSLDLRREWSGGESADFYADMTMSIPARASGGCRSRRMKLLRHRLPFPHRY